jgi:ketosteroid isomerase-like protein
LTGGAENTVREFWRLMATNDFHSVKAVLADSFSADWPQTNEHIPTPEAFCALNAAYPAAGPWRFTLNRLIATATEAVTDVTVTDGTTTARAITFFTVRDKRIQKITEYWPELTQPPFDRTQWTQPLTPETP